MQENKEQHPAGWENIEAHLSKVYGKAPDLPGILFLIGHRELGKHQTKFSKEQKQDLIHVAVCTLLSAKGYYAFVALDEDGWPHYEPTRNKPKLKHDEQELLLKEAIVDYFYREEIL